MNEERRGRGEQWAWPLQRIGRDQMTRGRLAMNDSRRRACFRQHLHRRINEKRTRGHWRKGTKMISRKKKENRRENKLNHDLFFSGPIDSQTLT
jgi:hypothetical protein